MNDTRHCWTESVKAALALTAIVMLCRAWIFGNPVVNIDEQFYLFVGDRMLHGALPYVDIWDRKPIGLFLIHAFAARAFGDPVLGYQILAALAVQATAWVIYRAARRFASFPAALSAAAAYPAWLNVFGGVGGQSPVFYNLPIAVAALWTMQTWLRSDGRHLTRDGCGIMLLAGIAMQIKYTAVFEGVFFGLSLVLAGLLRRQPGQGIDMRAMGGIGLLGRTWTMMPQAALWIACAVLPICAAWAWYEAIGHGSEFVQANFLSVLADDNPILAALEDLAGLLFGLMPFAVCAWFAWPERGGKDRNARSIRWLFAWTAASLFGFLVFGNWNDHYTLPLLTPLCLLAAAGFDRIAKRRLAMALLVGLGLAGGMGRVAIEWKITGNAAQAQRLFALVKPHLGSHCLYVNEEQTYLYRLTGSCLPTRFTFTQHLTIERYAKGLGVDQMGELRRLLESRPDVIVMSTIPDESTRWATRDMVESVLRTSYRQVGTETIGETPYAVYARNDSSRHSPIPPIR